MHWLKAFMLEESLEQARGEFKVAKVAKVFGLFIPYAPYPNILVEEEKRGKGAAAWFYPNTFWHFGSYPNMFVEDGQIRL